jgi:hypothetical protein
MAAVEVTISGVLYDKYNRTQQNVVLIGEGSLTGLQIGGGPVIPPGKPQPPDLGIWPNPPEGQAPLPSHPIALPGDPWWPKPPTEPPTDPGAVKPPPPEGGWGWSPEYGWGYFPGTGGAGPHKK